MKKKYYLLLNIGFLFFLIAAFFVLFLKNKPQDKEFLVQKASPAKNHQKETIISKAAIDSILKRSNVAILQISTSGCDLCEIAKSDSLSTEMEEFRLFLSKDADAKNNLLAQALYVTNFPSTYIIDRNYNVTALIKGVTEYKQRLKLALDSSKRNAFLKNLDTSIATEQKKSKRDSLIMLKHVLWHDIPNIDRNTKKENELPAISNAFKALMAKLDGNPNKMRYYARLSLSKVSYFFNNYLLYDYYQGQNMADSASYYKVEALKHSERVDQHIYASLIEELSGQKQ